MAIPIDSAVDHLLMSRLGHGQVAPLTEKYPDLGLEERPDTHGARLMGREEGDLGEALGVELACRCLEGEEHGVCGRVALEQDAPMVASDHRVVEDGYCTNRRLPLLCPAPRLGDGLGHVQLVVHGSESSRASDRLPPR